MGKRDGTMVNVDIVLSKILNTVNNLKFFMFGDKRLLKKNNELKIDERDGDVCFVIGNGPSLRKVDLSLIDAYPSFTVNEFYEKPGSFRADYHVLIDPGFGEGPGFEVVKRIYRLDKNIRLIMDDRFYRKMKQEGLADARTYFVHIGYVQYKEYVKCDMCRCMTGALNVLPVAIECAVWMGYKKIYLLGCDFDFYGNTKYTHFYDEDDGSVTEDDLDPSLETFIRCGLVRQHHFALRYKTEKSNIEIVNLTEGSLLDTYKRADLESILKEIKK